MVAVSTPLSHTTVLLDEAVEALLAHRTSGGSPRYVDATFGRGGHTRCLLARLPATATVIAFDKDPEAIAEADAGWVTMHGPKIEHKRRQGELNAALACGGGTDQIADDSLSPAEILAAQREADAHRQAA